MLSLNNKSELGLALQSTKVINQFIIIVFIALECNGYISIHNVCNLTQFYFVQTSGYISNHNLRSEILVEKRKISLGYPVDHKNGCKYKKFVYTIGKSVKNYGG